MDQIWSDLSKTCDDNEKRLKALKAFSESLPRQPQNWFYLNEDYLWSPHSFPETRPEPADEKSMLLSFFKVNEPKTLSNSDVCNENPDQRDVLSAKTNSDRDQQDVNFSAVLDDPDFPLSVRQLLVETKPEGAQPLSESDAVAFCQYLVNLDKYISEETGVAVLNRTIFPLICSSENMFVSILLLEKIRELANKYPIFMMNGVIVPALSKELLDKERLDIVRDILSGMNEDCLNAVLKSFLVAITRSDDVSLKLITTVMNRKPKLDNEMAFVLVTKLHSLSDHYSTNIQFGKMLLEVIPVLNAKLTDASLKILKDIVDRHNTFLKFPIRKIFNELAPIK